MKIEDESRREFYGCECVEAGWSVRQLELKRELELERELIERQRTLENGHEGFSNTLNAP